MNTERECPYCLSSIGENDDTIVCNSCEALYHKECWVEAEGCCIRGCANFKNSVEIDIAADRHDILVISREAAESAIAYHDERFSNPCLRCGRQVPQGSLYCADCTPEQEKNQDARNLGPLLIMLAILVLALAGLYGAVVLTETQTTAPSPSEIKTNIDR